jgi:hypothetical protein
MDQFIGAVCFVVGVFLFVTVVVLTTMFFTYKMDYYSYERCLANGIAKTTCERFIITNSKEK